MTAVVAFLGGTGSSALASEGRVSCDGLPNQSAGQTLRGSFLEDGSADIDWTITFGETHVVYSIVI